MNRVLVVDDEAGMRTALEAHFVRRDWRVDTAANAGEALEKFRRGLHPLVVTDIRMPGSDGFSLMREARSLAPHTAVILLTAFANVPDAVTAMKGGACDYVPKQLASTSLDILHIRGDLIAKIKAAAESRRSRDQVNLLRKPPGSELSKRDAPSSIPAIVALGTSTGGPKALEEILPHLPEDLPVPILIVQHMPAGCTTPFAARLDNLCNVAVREASHGEVVRPGVVYFAPSGSHMRVDRPTNSRTVVCLSVKPENQLHVPSVDVTMQSVASAFHSEAMGVIMTGMGTDGSGGMKAIHQEGGFTLGQDEQSSAVYGMPRVCAEMRILDKVVPLSQIPREILRAIRYRTASAS
jgi:two-component system chemotaxis response regulator CheB